MSDKYVEPGNIVDVYQDPITQKDFEGKAKAIKPVGAMLPGGLQYWKVNFVGDHYTDTYRRKIKAIK